MMEVKQIVIIGKYLIEYKHIEKPIKGKCEFCIYDRMHTDSRLISQNEKIMKKYLESLNKQGFIYTISMHTLKGGDKIDLA